jgi:hypothetical protein
MLFTRRAIEEMEDPGWGPTKTHEVDISLGGYTRLTVSVEAQEYTYVVEDDATWYVFWRDGKPVEQVRASAVNRIKVVDPSPGEPICDTGACCEARR